MSKGYLLGHIAAATTTGGLDPRVDKAGMLHWSKASRQGPPGRNQWTADFGKTHTVPDAQVARMQAGLPQLVRRDPKERYRSMLTRISEEALKSYRATGKISWPKSAEAELKLIAWKTGDPTLNDLGGIDQLHRQIEALTRHIVETGEAKQQAKNAKKVILDYHGH